MLICSYLVKQCEGLIEIKEQNEKVHILLKIPFLPFDPNNQGPYNAYNVSSINPFTENIMRQSELVHENSGISPSSGNAIRYPEQSQQSSSRQGSDKLSAPLLQNRRTSINVRNNTEDYLNGEILSSNSKHGRYQKRPGAKLSSKSGVLFNRTGETPTRRKYRQRKQIKTHISENERIQSVSHGQNDSRFTYHPSLKNLIKSKGISESNVLSSSRGGPRMSLVIDGSNSQNIPSYIKEDMDDSESNFEGIDERIQNGSRAILVGLPEYDINTHSVR